MPAAYLSSEVQNLVKGLLQKEASKRLGYGASGSQDVMRHAFFKGVDWKQLERRQVRRGGAGGACKPASLPGEGRSEGGVGVGAPMLCGCVQPRRDARRRRNPC